MVFIRNQHFERGMGRNKRTRKRIEGLRLQINLHEQKIAAEQNGANPDAGLVKHWEKEVKTWKDQEARLRHHLPQKRK
jgi:hypothetical protein